MKLIIFLTYGILIVGGSLFWLFGMFLAVSLPFSIVDMFGGQRFTLLVGSNPFYLIPAVMICLGLYYLLYRLVRKQWKQKPTYQLMSYGAAFLFSATILYFFIGLWGESALAPYDMMPLEMRPSVTELPRRINDFFESGWGAELPSLITVGLIGAAVLLRKIIKRPETLTLLKESAAANIFFVGLIIVFGFLLIPIRPYVPHWYDFSVLLPVWIVLFSIVLFLLHYRGFKLQEKTSLL